MAPFIVEGLSGIPLDPGTAHQQESRQTQGTREKESTALVSFKGGRLLEEIEEQKSALLSRPFLRQGRLDSARNALGRGGVPDEGRLAEAAENMLMGDAAEDLAMEEL